MPRRKLKKFAEIKQSTVFMDCVENTEIVDIKQWFGNDNPVVLELGAGYGEYTIGLAQQNPDTNYIAVDIKSDRLWMGLSWVKEKSLSNVRLLRCNIYLIDEIFSADSINDIWLTFSDPQPHKPRKRLTSLGYFQKYHTIQKTGAKLHIKTDSQLVYETALESITVGDLYERVEGEFSCEVDASLQISTRYEDKFRRLGKTIHYLQATKR